jgi:Tol biopolymer transport system component
MRKPRFFVLLMLLVCFGLLTALNLAVPASAQSAGQTSTPTAGTPGATPTDLTRNLILTLTALPTNANITPTVPVPAAIARGQIAFRDGFSLYLVQGSGQGRRNVGNDRQYVYFCPAYSRDGNKIAIIGGGTGYEVYAMDGFGGGQHAVVKKGDLTTDTPAGSTSWSPDSKQIAFTGANSGPFYIVGADGKNLTTVQGAAFINLDWSPDGTSFVAFAADKDGKLGIYTVAVDGTGLKLLLALPDSDRSTTLNADNFFSRDVVWPRWSPDGKQIAFASSKDGPLSLYIMDADGQNLHRVLPANAAPAYAPSWSPDGNYLAFMSAGGLDTGIYTVKVTGEEFRLVTIVLSGGCPAWQLKAQQ